MASAPDQPIGQEQKEKNSATKSKSVRPEFSRFIDELSVIIGQRARPSLTDIYRLLKRGFKEDITSQRVDEICKLLLLWDWLPYLGLRISSEVVTGKCPPLCRRLYRRIREEMAKQVSFPLDRIPLFTNVSGPERKQQILDWIDHNTSQGSLDFDWARKALISVLGDEITRDDLEIMYVLLERSSVRKKKRAAAKTEAADPKQAHLPYLKQTISLFSSRKKPTPKISLAVDISSFYKKEKAAQEKEVASLLSKHEDLVHRLQEANNGLNGAWAELLQKNEFIENLSEELKKQQRSLNDEKERYESLDNHWKEECVRQVSKKATSLRRYFEHEIREAQLALDCSNPDAEMALKRIEHMKEFISRMEEES